MKKNEDTKKRSEEGKIVLKKGIWISISFCLLFSLSEDINPQIPINGFCVRNSYQIPAGYDKILSADLNNDQIDELIVYSPLIRKIGIVSFSGDGEIIIREFPVAYEFSNIKYLDDSAGSRFVCVSRKNRLVAVCEFKLNTPPALKSKITFDSYPENVSLGDINKDNITEVLVSGAGFDGLSVLMRKDGRLAEKKIVSGESFSEAVFSDLSNDGYTDIAALNIIDNSTQFYFSNTGGDFRFVRDTRTEEKTKLLYSLDLNNDNFQDLIFNRGNQLSTLYGDFRAEYKKKNTIQLKNVPGSIQTGDYNNDLITDIAYVNSVTGNMNILFGRNGNEFYDEITYTNLSSPFQIADFRQKGKNCLVILSKDGFLTTVSSYKKDFKSIDIIPAVKAAKIEKFDLKKDGISDLCYIDKSDSSFRVITRNSNGIPHKFYLKKLNDSHQSIVIDDFSNSEKTFYCYSREKQLIEFLRINFAANKFIHKHLYSPGKIKALAVQRVDSNLVNIYLLYLKGNKLYSGKFEHRDLSLTFKEYPFIDRDVINAEFSLNQEIRAYYWKLKSDSTFFNEVTIKTGPNIYRGIAGLNGGDSIKISFASSNQLFDGKPWLMSLVNIDNESYLFSFKNDRYKILHEADMDYKLNFIDDEKLSFAELQNDGNVNFLIYHPDSRSLNKLVIPNKGKTYSLKEIAEKVDINYYFIDKFNATNYQLVYSNKEKGCISIIQL